MECTFCEGAVIWLQWVVLFSLIVLLCIWCSPEALHLTALIITIPTAQLALHITYCTATRSSGPPVLSCAAPVKGYPLLSIRKLQKEVEPMDHNLIVPTLISFGIATVF